MLFLLNSRISYLLTRAHSLILILPLSFLLNSGLYQLFAKMRAHSLYLHKHYYPSLFINQLFTRGTRALLILTVYCNYDLFLIHVSVVCQDARTLLIRILTMLFLLISRVSYLLTRAQSLILILPLSSLLNSFISCLLRRANTLNTYINITPS